MASSHSPPPSSPSPTVKPHIRDPTSSDLRQTDPAKKPFTPSSYVSRYPHDGSLPKGYKRPVKRRSIFTEELDPTVLDAAISSTTSSERRGETTSSGTLRQRNTTSGPHPNSNISNPPPRSSNRANNFLSINPVKSKDSYMMHLPLQPIRISVLLLFLVAFATISLSTSSDALVSGSDISSLHARVPKQDPNAWVQDEVVVQRREASIAPSFRIGPAVRNPEKDIPKLRTGLLVLGISLVFAGLMT